MNEMIMVYHSLINNTAAGLIISLCSNTNLLISLIPRITSDFRHLLSCGTIGISNMTHQNIIHDSSKLANSM